MSLCNIDCLQASNDLRASEERFRLVFEYAPIGMAIVNLDGSFQRVNQALSNLVGYCVEDFSTMKLSDITPQEDIQRIKAAADTASQEEAPRFALETRFFCHTGELINVLLHVALVRSPQNEPMYYIGQIVDITDRKRYEEAIKHMAYHDPLTGLPNRMLFRDRLTLALAQARANQDVLAVVFLDLDRFKDINDTLGHYIGDKALKQIAKRLAGAVRKTDVVARMGGDEFTLLLPSVGSRENVNRIVEKMVSIIEEPLHFENKEFVVSASVGVALYPEDASEVDSLLQNADKLMYLNKQDKDIVR